MNRKGIYAASRQCLRDAEPSPRKLTLLFALTLYGVFALFDLISVALDTGGGAGLSGAVRQNSLLSILSAGSFVLSLASVVWNTNYLSYALRLSRGQETSYRDFVTPFRKAGTILLVRILSYIYTYFWTLLFMLPGMLVLGGVPIDLPPAADFDQIYNAVLNTMMTSPVAHFGILLCALAVIPGFIMSYRYALAPFMVFHHDASASQALRESKLLSRGRKKDLLLMDLHFWYYFLLTAIPSALMVLSLYGLLPIPEAAVELIGYVQYVWMTLLMVWKLPEVSTVRAHAFNAILEATLKSLQNHSAPEAPQEPPLIEG